MLFRSVKAGRVRAIAMTSSSRSSIAPDLPTVIESGFPGFEAGAWFSLAVPAGVPEPIVRNLNAVVNRVGQSPEVRDKLMNQSSAEPMPGTPEQAAAFVRNDIRRWREIGEKAQITLQQ